MLRKLLEFLGLATQLVVQVGAGRSSRWPAVRAAHLKANPTCAACGAREKLEVHHLYPVGWPHGADFELEPGNLLTLCERATHNCHFWVGHLGDWKSRNPHARLDASQLLTRIKNRPYPAFVKPEEGA